ncbi:hypothetical protein Tco_0589997 [Tanacetum coccineum]
MPNTNNTMPTQTSSVLHNDTVSWCSTSKVQEKTQLSRSRCMNSLREVKSQFKFLSETLQDFGTMPIFKRTFSQDLDLLEQHLTKDITSQTDCNTTLTKLRTKKYMREIILHQQRTLQLLKQKKLMQTQEDHSNPIQALNVDSLKVDLVVIQNTCFEKEDSNSKTASSKSVKESSLDSATKDKSVAERTRHQRQYDRRVNKRQMKTQESTIDSSKALDVDLVVTESSGTESEVQNDSSR